MTMDAPQPEEQVEIDPDLFGKFFVANSHLGL